MDLGRKDRHVDRRKRLCLDFVIRLIARWSIRLTDCLKEGHELNTLALWAKLLEGGS